MGADGTTGTVQAEFTVHPGTPTQAQAVTAGPAAATAVPAQLARILSLDVDGTDGGVGRQVEGEEEDATAAHHDHPALL